MDEVTPRRLACQGVVRSVAFERLSTRDPSRLAGAEVVDLLETKRFELPRSSWAHVSGVVPAIDDDRTRTIEVGNRVAIEHPERDVYRAGQMLFGVLLL